jgi:hypothetical protein
MCVTGVERRLTSATSYEILTITRKEVMLGALLKYVAGLICELGWIIAIVSLCGKEGYRCNV